MESTPSFGRSRSFPEPPSSVSSPAPPVSVTGPVKLLAFSVLSLSPPVRLACSIPAIVSVSEAVLNCVAVSAMLTSRSSSSVSVPPPPMMRSLPAPPVRVSSWAEPVSVSAPVPPTRVTTPVKVLASIERPPSPPTRLARPKPEMLSTTPPMVSVVPVSTMLASRTS